MISPITPGVATKDFQLGDLLISKGLVVEIACLSMHRDPALWGKDTAESEPERFENLGYPNLAHVRTPSCRSAQDPGSASDRK